MRSEDIYTLPNEENPDYSYSFDGFLRGEEILSGAIRINDYNKLIEKVDFHGISHNDIEDYLNSFKYGVPKHGGIGMGLERLVKLILDYENVKMCSMFPRDPKRISP